MREGLALLRLHRVLISMGIGLSVIFGAYQVRELSEGRGNAVYWVAACVVLALALSTYLVWFNRKTKAKEERDESKR